MILMNIHCFQLFTRIWPTNQTHKYFRYFKSIPYSEKLMGECFSSWRHGYSTNFDILLQWDFISVFNVDTFQMHMSIITRIIEGRGWSMWANIAKRNFTWKCQNRCFGLKTALSIYVWMIQKMISHDKECSIWRLLSAGRGATAEAQKRLSFRPSFRFSPSNQFQ